MGFSVLLGLIRGFSVLFCYGILRFFVFFEEVSDVAFETFEKGFFHIDYKFKFRLNLFVVFWRELGGNYNEVRKGLEKGVRRV